MSPADIVASAEFRAGLVRRLVEVGLVAPDPAALRLAALADLSVQPDSEQRKAA
jgi:hypothetical protein